MRKTSMQEIYNVTFKQLSIIYIRRFIAGAQAVWPPWLAYDFTFTGQKVPPSLHFCGNIR